MRPNPFVGLAVCLLAYSLASTAEAQARINHARHGVASQSSTLPGGMASRAIDGSAEAVWSNGSLSHTIDQSGSWWEVALGGRKDVLEIILHNRSDCCWARLSNFRVSLFDGVSEVHGSDWFTTGGSVGQGGAFTVTLPPAMAGDRMRIALLGPNSYGDNVLSFAEVEVLGPSGGLANIAPLGIASQSSIASGGAAQRGIDGWINGAWNQGTTTHTDPSDTNSWWEVDLVNTWSLAEVNLYNRGDCCWTRLSNFRVSVFSGATEVFGQDFFVGAGNVAQHDKLVTVLPAGTYGDRVRVQLLGQNNDGNGVLSLSEVEVIGGEVGSVYCTSASSSWGEPIHLAAHGSADVSRNDLTLVASNLPGGMAVGFYGPDAATMPAGDGTLCISPGWVGFYLRLGRPAPVAADGVALLPIDLTTPRRAKGKIVPGSTWRFQVWFSDAGGSKGYGFSEAIAIQFQ
ncbi:MAG TPA: hypothetical protein EYQ74_12225 [Planctomycetes bacterium]|nr:hypothetical protein [Planctomycetota bacterium]HIK59783.1 hypothetical protein [Planctomycetota bacterium]